MENKNKASRVARLRKGMASAILVASLATTFAPVLTASAEVLEYPTENAYKTANTAQYVIDINPMIGTTAGFTPHGGVYSVRQVARYTRTGERIEVDGTARTVTLTADNNNQIRVDADGEYEITPVQRIPGFLKDLGATEETDGTSGSTPVDAQGFYRYAFPLIASGVPSADQVVNFQPKLREARADLEIEKLGDTGQPLGGIEFEIFQRYDAQLNATYADGAESVGTVSTGSDGKVTLPDLIEGRYYFVEDAGSVADRYLPDTRKIEFDVVVASDEETVSIVATDEGDITTVGNNVRGYQTGNTITRFNYIDPTQNAEQTYQSVKSTYVGTGYDTATENRGSATGNNNGIVYVNTNGTLEFSSSVDIPKNFNDFENFSIVDTLDDKVTLNEDSVQLRIMNNNDGLVSTHDLADFGGDFTANGQEITINALGSNLRSALVADGVDYIVLTYSADVDTDEIAKGLEYETLSFTQTLDTDATLLDGTNPSKTTVNETSVRVREGRIVVDKVASDGQGTKLEGAEFQLYRPVVDGETAEFTEDGIGWVKATNPRGDNANYHGATNANGVLSFDELPYGEYLIRETKAPEGYRINSQSTRVSLVDGETAFTDGANQTITQIQNMRRSQIFPGTGTTGNILTIMAIAVAGTTFVAVTVKKRKGLGSEEA